MTDKTEHSYTQVFDFVNKNILHEFKISSCMTDFELGMINAIKIAFPNIVVKHCHFHYCQVY